VNVDDIERTAAQQAPEIARQLLAIAGRGGTEADFRREAARLLETAGLEAGMTITPHDEFSVARGLVDSVYNRPILEYKRPGALHTSNRGKANRQTIDQVKDYILGVAKRERREAHRLAGVATDGFYFIFVRRVRKGWAVDDPMPVNAASAEGFLRLLCSLSAGAALVPENLVTDFGPRTLRAQRAARWRPTHLPAIRPEERLALRRRRADHEQAAHHAYHFAQLLRVVHLNPERSHAPVRQPHAQAVSRALKEQVVQAQVVVLHPGPVTGSRDTAAEAHSLQPALRAQRSFLVLGAQVHHAV